MQESCARLQRDPGLKRCSTIWDLRLDRTWALIPEQNLAAAHQLFVDPQAILIRTDFGAGARRAGLQAHADWCLKNIGAKRAAVDVEFDAQIAGIADPGDLIAGIEDYYFGENTNENGAFGHGESLQLTVQS